MSADVAEASAVAEVSAPAAMAEVSAVAEVSARRHAEQVWRAMTMLVTELNDRKTEVSAELGMSFVRIKALRRVAHSSMSMRELAEQLMTDAPYTTVVVDDLEQRGLVDRRPDPDDRRRKIVAATPDGVRAARRAEGILRTPPTALTALTPADLAELDRILALLLPA